MEGCCVGTVVVDVGLDSGVDPAMSKVDALDNCSSS